MFPEQRGTMWWFQGAVTPSMPSSCLDVWLYLMGPELSPFLPGQSREECTPGRCASTTVSREARATAALLELREGSEAGHCLCPPTAWDSFSSPVLSSEADWVVTLGPCYGLIVYSLNSCIRALTPVW